MARQKPAGRLWREQDRILVRSLAQAEDLIKRAEEDLARAKSYRDAIAADLIAHRAARPKQEGEQ